LHAKWCPNNEPLWRLQEKKDFPVATQSRFVEAFVLLTLILKMISVVENM